VAMIFRAGHCFLFRIKFYLKSRKHTERASSIIYTGIIQK
jgi:hypothetical protein